MKVYIACGLTHVPRNRFLNYTSFLHNLAEHLVRHDGHEVKYALVNSDPQLATKPLEERARLCYLWDTKIVQDADVIIGECSYPSIGLGIELQVATACETPIILAFRNCDGNRADPVRYKNPDATEHDLQIGEGFVSLMALGMPTLFKVHRYFQDEEAIALISQSVWLLQQYRGGGGVAGVGAALGETPVVGEFRARPVQGRV